MSIVSASQAGVIGCRSCGLACRHATNSAAVLRCPRCGSRLRPRKADSLSRSWALLLAAALLYIPANLLPVMETSSLFGSERDTILNGIVFFWTSGSQGLAALIFTVSILVPLLKLGTLSFLAVSIHRRSARGLHKRARLFRIVEFVGRWSMLDVFVVALMVGLVHFRGLATIEAGPGAAAFGAVVVLTMLAARTFDVRLIWDCAKDEDDDD